MDFLGFCVWSIVKRKGLLIPGKATLGVYKYKERNCVFCDENALNEFLEDPDYYINGIYEQCKKNPELIHLLRMEDSFQGVNLSLYM